MLKISASCYRCKKVAKALHSLPNQIFGSAARDRSEPNRWIFACGPSSCNIRNRLVPVFHMPSFDVVSEVDKQEVDNALNQSRKELKTRFDFKGIDATIEVTEANVIELKATDASRLKSLQEIVIGKFAARNVDLRNVDRMDPVISPLGHARQELRIKQGLDGDKAKEIIMAIKDLGLKVQCQLQDRQVRVTGKKRDDLQKVIQFLRSKDFRIGLAFKNFRD